MPEAIPATRSERRFLGFARKPEILTYTQFMQFGEIFLVVSKSHLFDDIENRAGASIRTALVYSGELAPSVEAAGYFDAIVSFRRLLGL